MSPLVPRPACPVCRHHDHRVRLQLPYDDPALAGHLEEFYGGRADLDRLAGATYELRECGSCSLLYQAEVPDEALLREVYDRWIDPDASRAASRARLDVVADGYGRLVDELAAAADQPVERLRVLDLGMGWGGLADVARQRGCAVAGVELSEARRRDAATRGIGVVDPDAEEPGSYDVVVALQVLEHVTAPADELRRVAGLLRPGGVAHVEVPDGSARRIGPVLRHVDWSAPKGSRRSMNPVAPLEHLNCYRRRSLDALVGAAGLTAVAPPRGTGPSTLAAQAGRWVRPSLALGVTARR